jgi:hypothetical protein
MKAGEWRHLAFSYSLAQHRLRMYLDGVLTFENDTPFSMPAGDGASFTIDSDPYGDASAFLVDELRISSDEKTAAQIRYDAQRSTPFADQEVLLPLNNVAAGQLTYSVNGCGTATYAYIGVPISNVSPPSTLVPSGSTSIQLSVQTIAASSCGYSTGSLADLASMKPFNTGQGGVVHVTTVSGLLSDSSLVNRVYVRCALAPDYVVPLQYRALPLTKRKEVTSGLDITSGVVTP